MSRQHGWGIDTDPVAMGRRGGRQPAYCIKFRKKDVAEACGVSMYRLRKYLRSNKLSLLRMSVGQLVDLVNCFRNQQGGKE